MTKSEHDAICARCSLMGDDCGGKDCPTALDDDDWDWDWDGEESE